MGKVLGVLFNPVVCPDCAGPLGYPHRCPKRRSEMRITVTEGECPFCPAAGFKGEVCRACGRDRRIEQPLEARVVIKPSPIQCAGDSPMQMSTVVEWGYQARDPQTGLSDKGPTQDEALRQLRKRIGEYGPPAYDVTPGEHEDVVDCGGQTVDSPPCGGCDRCLEDQAEHVVDECRDPERCGKDGYQCGCRNGDFGEPAPWGDDAGQEPTLWWWWTIADLVHIGFVIDGPYDAGTLVRETWKDGGDAGVAGELVHRGDRLGAWLDIPPPEWGPKPPSARGEDGRIVKTKAYPPRKSLKEKLEDEVMAPLEARNPAVEEEGFFASFDTHMRPDMATRCLEQLRPREQRVGAAVARARARKANVFYFDVAGMVEPVRVLGPADVAQDGVLTGAPGHWAKAWSSRGVPNHAIYELILYFYNERTAKAIANALANGTLVD